ncbi:alpha/beta fold hydrolase [Sulfobacillus thermosulfidooxidans]|uniref:alpha/beta fold hydrolase n=1 Tax=Sulfobacillus thermosulfidooxidans TaxID=28034 RepID=UPI000318E0A8|nr:alpha/beta hydrolase [Sulfobacillus thermosulfidooxidans]
MIFLPAMGWTAESAGPLVSVLEERYHFHRLDLPGLGRSEPLSKIPTWKDLALWIHQYCEQHQWNQVRIIGHSLGGIMALAYADHFPDRVYQLVLLDAGYQPIPRFPQDIATPFRYLVPAVNILASLGGVKLLTRWIGERRVPGNALSVPDMWEQEFQEFVEHQHLLITNELREAFYTARKLVTINPLAVNLLLGIYRSKPVTAFSRLKPATLLVVPEHMTHYSPLTQIDEKGLPILLYEVNGGHFVHYAHPEVAYVIRDFFDHWN